MIRNLKILFAAAMALAAFGAVSASGAQAANEFHCSTKPCTLTIKPDGTGATAHQVFIVKQGANSLSTTCKEVSGHATIEQEAVSSARFTNIKYTGCNIAGSASVVEMNGCEYNFISSGVQKATVTVICPEGKSIEIKTTEGPVCIIKVGSQGPLAGIKFHDAETEGIKKQILTAEVDVVGLSGTVNGGCTGLKEGAVTGEYTTGNVEITGETDPGGVMKNVWFE
jgi:hypothetical protein